MNEHPPRRHERPLNVLIGTDFWGAGNVGDDFMLEGFLLWAHRAAPCWSISVLCAHDIEAMRRRFPQCSWVSADEPSRRTACESSDLWVGLGGAIFQSDLGPWILDRVAADLAHCAEVGVPGYLVGVGLNNDDAARTEQARKIHHLAKAIWARDKRCHRVLAAAGLDEGKLYPGSDVSHIAFAERGSSQHLSGVAACLIIGPDQLEWSALASALLALGDTPAWVCQEIRPLAGSELSLFEAMPRHLRDRLTLRCPHYRDETLDELVQKLRGFETVLTSRYHMSLCSAWDGAKVAVHDRNQKLTGAREELGLVECPDLTSPEAITRALRDARPVDRTRLHECAQRAVSMLDDFAAVASAAAGLAV
jgi:polysaccharide pyruvyl transferase WcaK-like protein